jgi:hypothetical protein
MANPHWAFVLVRLDRYLGGESPSANARVLGMEPADFYSGIVVDAYARMKSATFQAEPYVESALKCSISARKA